MLSEKQLQEIEKRAKSATISDKLPYDDIHRSVTKLLGVLSNSIGDIPILMREVKLLKKEVEKQTFEKYDIRADNDWKDNTTMDQKAEIEMLKNQIEMLKGYLFNATFVPAGDFLEEPTKEELDQYDAAMKKATGVASIANHQAAETREMCKNKADREDSKDAG